MPGLIASADLDASLPALFAPVTAAATIGLAVSGGADSLALLLLAQRWAGAHGGPRLVVYSVDHGLRAEAADEAAFVCATAAELGLPARALRWDGPRPTAGVQAAARTARYRLIGAAMAADGAEVLLTAHHRGDQAETVLMRLAHGSGLEGLRGMDAISTVEGVRVFRPLLGVSRETLAAIVAAAGLTPVADPSNADSHYERVRWREAMPVFAGLGLDDAALATFARRAGEADAALAQWAARAWQENVSFDALGAAGVSAAALSALPRAVAIRLLARLVETVGGRQRPHVLGAIERLHTALTAPEVFAGQTIAGTAIRRRGDTLWLAREAGRQPPVVMSIGARQVLAWDRRFRIANRSADAVQVHMAHALTRPAAERMVSRKLLSPAAAIRSAPLVIGVGNAPLALGCYCLSPEVTVELLGSAADLPQP